MAAAVDLPDGVGEDIVARRAVLDQPQPIGLTRRQEGVRLAQELRPPLERPRQAADAAVARIGDPVGEGGQAEQEVARHPAGVGEALSQAGVEIQGVEGAVARGHHERGVRLGIEQRGGSGRSGRGRRIDGRRGRIFLDRTGHEEQSGDDAERSGVHDG